jgi:Family of unknown function (DUF6452)
MKGISKIMLLIMLVVLGTSCFDEPDCVILNTSSIKIDFKQNKLNRTTNRTSVADTALSFNAIKISGLDKNFNKQDTTASSLTLPIDPNQTTMIFTFVRNTPNSGKTTESITFTYDVETRVISTKCGAYPFYLNLQIQESTYGQSQYKVTSSRLLKSTTNVQVFF